ncbi:MAG TPA: cytochrome b/b6 domain-containing protein [Blastocatellia bacterium]|nr:cytochrome b/b6 domain-containing protein [Blastocatellia bacterium]
MKRIALLSLVCLCMLFGVDAWRRGLAVASAAGPALANSDCLACHNDGAFATSVHGTLNCTSCHADIKQLPHGAAQRVACGSCHTDANAAYSHGLHAKAIRSGEHRAATCTDCHGGPHQILRSSEAGAPTNHRNIAETCGRCHGEKFVMEGTGLTNRPFLSYQASVHGHAVAQGNAVAATCTDCHSSHDIRPPNDAASPIFKLNVPKTCGQCHPTVAQAFRESIHGQAVARGNSQAPVCTDCHGIHMIKPHVDPTSRVAAQALARTTCAQCHESVKLSDEFDVAGHRASSYLDSYHGLASELNSKKVANCASCHGVHNILPSTDARSTINAGHLRETCGKCHPGASDQFIQGKIHLDGAVTARDIGSLATSYVRWIYLSLIFLTIGGMLAHNGLIWRKKLAAHRRMIERSIVRMTTQQRAQHWLLLTSFFVLVLTGFALKYPGSWLGLAFGASETLRRVLHRGAAAVMLGVGFYHLGYISLSREGRQSVLDMLPRLQDARDMMQNLRYLFGRTSARPQFARFGYAEKVEYWALIWGTFIMGLTGVMIWFKLEWFGFAPRWLIDVATAVHFYEAILATAAIIVWHFYHVIFDPNVYPLNLAMVDGRVSAHWYREEHGLDYERLMCGDSESAAPTGRSPLTEPEPNKGSGYDTAPAPSEGD